MYTYAGDDPVNASDPTGLYTYQYSWYIGQEDSTSIFGPATAAFDYLANHVHQIFPFSTGNCGTFTLGEQCVFHPGAGVDHLYVKTLTPSSVTLKVQNWCQSPHVFGTCPAGDPPGSTIMFTTSDRPDSLLPSSFSDSSSHCAASPSGGEFLALTQTANAAWSESNQWAGCFGVCVLHMASAGTQSCEGAPIQSRQCRPTRRRRAFLRCTGHLWLTAAPGHRSQRSARALPRGMVALCDLAILAIAGFMFLWAVWIGAGAWPSYWWLTALAGLVGLAAVFGVGAAILLALPEDRADVSVSTLRRVAFVLLAPAIGSLVASVAVFIVVGITVPSFF